MRLGQLARKYDVSTQEIINYLKRIDPTNGIVHPNAKLDEQTEQLIAKHFDLLLDPSEEPVMDFVDDDFEEESKSSSVEIIEVVGTEQTEVISVSTSEEIHEETSILPEPPAHQITEEETITSDRLLELMESEDINIDLSKITRIKAPKRELDGLKVLGKIELPEPKKKVPEAEESQSNAKRNSGKNQQRTQVSAEEAEQRRLWAKMKKEENELRLEKKRKEKEKEQLKALKEAHYKQKAQRIKTKRQKPKEKVQELVDTVPIVEEQQPEPKTVLGKFWRWLNT